MSSFAQIEKELIVKYVKGVAIFLVLCFAAYGAFVLFKPTRDNTLSESQRKYLNEELGINVANDGQAEVSGLSGMFSAEGIAPVGAIGPSTSSAPPSFLVEPTTSFAAPFEADAPRVASVDAPGFELQAAPEFSSPEATVLPPPNFSEPAVESPTAAPPFLGAPPISATPPNPSPPPLGESWDGPVIPVMPSPVASFQDFPPTTQPSPLSEIPSPVHEQIAYQPIGRTSIRRIASDSENQGYSPATTAAIQDFSTSDSVPLAAAQQPAPAYTRTAARSSLSFEPVKPEPQPNAPVVSFGRPKQIAPPQPLPEQVQARLVATPSAPPVAQPATPSIAPEIAEFIQSQRLLAESGNPENMRRAFIQLSQLYERNQLGAPERTMMQPILDMLALKVIYAKDTHILEPPYRVKPGETVESIAKDFNLTPTLLCKINGLTGTQELPVGTTLKVLYGQFDAQISTQRRELTLLLGGLYAGRFSCSLSQTGSPMHGGEFYVTNRSDRSIALNNGWILGSASTQNATIVFVDHDAREIFGILSEQSVVVVE